MIVAGGIILAMYLPMFKIYELIEQTPQGLPEIFSVECPGPGLRRRLLGVLA